MRKPFYLALMASIAMTGLTALPASAQDGGTVLNIGLQDDPDTLDPATNWSFVGRHVLQQMCDKIVDINGNNEIVPMLATDWTWNEDSTQLTLNVREDATFHDGTPVNAEAIKYNLDRALTLEISRRASEISAIESVEVVDEFTVQINLSEPSVPLLAALTDRAGMIISPAAGEELGEDFTNDPVCSGPYEFVERVAQDYIELEKFDDYYAADDYAFDRLIFRGMPDSNTRLLNLRSGQFDLIERLAATDVASVDDDPALETAPVVGLGYYGITIDIGGEGADPDFSQQQAVREAFSLAIDREAINQVVFEGQFAVGNQPFPPTSPYYNQDMPVQPRDVEAARALMEEAGIDQIDLELLVPTDAERQQVATLIQSMVAEIGINVEIRPTELMTLLDTAREGNFEAHLVGWSGRVDPDLNITPMLSCGAAGNDAHYCSEELDTILTEARAVGDVATRQEKYSEAVDLLLTDLPIVYLYHSQWIFAHDAALEGFDPFPDGIIRLGGVTMTE
ncbi:ABC transporter substrate-binding protein [Pelagibacterium nitratireducens]|uniref:ABC transporter substrate-binding protein n=1 Tax=Pelagibacterium nitratireducens TaxID=1046114 RepID=A0ABZ2HZ21_9HYPH|tara:strand:+ start:8622 stop:10148 length:1527 start_codon:yes stop_codon:yes gene_type:complete